jgi:TRAP-type mannitol/chloroaromatic compound transport system permease small subunit
MSLLLHLAGLIDALNERVGRAVYWLVLVMVLVSAGNAVSRKAFDVSSNAFLEIQWYLYAAVFLLAAGYTLKHNEHVRIDVVSARFGARGRAWVDLFGGVFFLLPLTLLVLYFAWPYFLLSWQSQEWSSNPGGLIIWPAKALIPIGFVLLLLQGVAEIIKRIAFLLDATPPDSRPHVR